LLKCRVPATAVVFQFSITLVLLHQADHATEVSSSCPARA
jgi:hypothetical protein